MRGLALAIARTRYPTRRIRTEPCFEAPGVRVPSIGHAAAHFVFGTVPVAASSLWKTITMTHRRMFLACSLGFVLLAAPAQAQDPVPSDEALEGAFPQRRHYSPHAERDFPTNVYWGDTHLHTANSPDAGACSATRLGLDEAYRFARGEQVTSSTGLQGEAGPPARLPGRRRPLRQHGLLPADCYAGAPNCSDRSSTGRQAGTSMDAAGRRNRVRSRGRHGPDRRLLAGNVPDQR